MSERKHEERGMSAERFVTEQLVFDTAQIERMYFTGEIGWPASPGLGIARFAAVDPAGTYRLVCGSVYRVEPSLPPWETP